MSQELANLLVEENARLRAEVKDLKARLKAARAAWFDPGDALADERIVMATDLRQKNWRKP